MEACFELGIEKMNKRAFNLGRAFRAGMDYALKKRGIAMDDWVTLQNKEGEYYRVDLPGENPNSYGKKSVSKEKELAEAAKSLKLLEGSLSGEYVKEVRAKGYKDINDQWRTWREIEKKNPDLQKARESFDRLVRQNLSSALRDVEKNYTEEKYKDRNVKEYHQAKREIEATDDIHSLEQRLKRVLKTKGYYEKGRSDVIKEALEDKIKFNSDKQPIDVIKSVAKNRLSGYLDNVYGLRVEEELIRKRIKELKNKKE